MRWVYTQDVRYGDGGQGVFMLWSHITRMRHGSDPGGLHMDRRLGGNGVGVHFFFLYYITPMRRAILNTHHYDR